MFNIFKCPVELSIITLKDLSGENNRFFKTRIQNSYNKNTSLLFGTFLCIVSFAKGRRKRKGEGEKRKRFLLFSPTLVSQ